MQKTAKAAWQRYLERNPDKFESFVDRAADTIKRDHSINRPAILEDFEKGTTEGLKGNVKEKAAINTVRQLLGQRGGIIKGRRNKNYNIGLPKTLRDFQDDTSVKDVPQFILDSYRERRPFDSQESLYRHYRRYAPLRPSRDEDIKFDDWHEQFNGITWNLKDKLKSDAAQNVATKASTSVARKAAESEAQDIVDKLLKLPKEDRKNLSDRLGQYGRHLDDAISQAQSVENQFFKSDRGLKNLSDKLGLRKGDPVGNISKITSAQNQFAADWKKEKQRRQVEHSKLQEEVDKALSKLRSEHSPQNKELDEFQRNIQRSIAKVDAVERAERAARKGLSRNAKIGLGVGAGVLAAGGTAAAIHAYRKRKKRQQEEAQKKTASEMIDEMLKTAQCY